MLLPSFVVFVGFLSDNTTPVSVDSLGVVRLGRGPRRFCASCWADALLDLG